MSTSTSEGDYLPRTELHLIARECNKFYYGGLRKGVKECKPLFCRKEHIGFVPSRVEPILKEFPGLFHVSEEQIVLGRDLPDDAEVRSRAVENCLRELRERDSEEALVTLKGWREETYDVRTTSSFNEKPLFKMERSATCLFGLRQYGVDINGYVNHPEKGWCLWMQRRSRTKSTWPGMMDNFVGGGLSSGYGVAETAVKEAEEEANVDKELAGKMVSAGTVAIFYESARGLFPNTEYVFDLELPSDFTPGNNDGEVDGFELVPFGDVLGVLKSPEMKVTSIPVALDFLIRKGIVNQENEPDYLDVVGNLHLPIYDIYRSKLNA